MAEHTFDARFCALLISGTHHDTQLLTLVDDYNDIHGTLTITYSACPFHRSSLCY